MSPPELSDSLRSPRCWVVPDMYGPVQINQKRLDPLDAGQKLACISDSVVSTQPAYLRIFSSPIAE